MTETTSLSRRDAVTVYGVDTRDDTTRAADADSTAAPGDAG